MTTFTTLGRGRLMDFTNLPAIITAVSGVLVSIGLGAKWLLTRVDRNAKVDREWQEAERAKLEALFTARITGLEKQMELQERHIVGQDGEIRMLRNELTNYVRQVGVLEGLLKANKIEVPPFQKVGG